MKIIIKGDYLDGRVEVQVDYFVNCFVLYTRETTRCVEELEKLMKRVVPEALIEVVHG